MSFVSVFAETFILYSLYHTSEFSFSRIHFYQELFFCFLLRFSFNRSISDKKETNLRFCNLIRGFFKLVGKVANSGENNYFITICFQLTATRSSECKDINFFFGRRAQMRLKCSKQFSDDNVYDCNRTWVLNLVDMFLNAYTCNSLYAH